MDSDEDEGNNRGKITKARRRINRKNKLHVVFDEADRKEFLTGFHKRKLQRKKKAQEQLQQMLKEEKKKIKQQARDRMKYLKKSFEPIPELEKLFAKEYKVDNSTVSVLELDTDLLAEKNYLIGRNRVKVEDDNVSEEESKDLNVEEELPGMEIKRKENKKHNSDTGNDPHSKKSHKDPAKKPAEHFKHLKDLKRSIQKEATKTVKKSKAFKIQNKIVKQKQRKVSRHKKRLKAEAMSKKGKRLRRARGTHFKES